MMISRKMMVLLLSLVVLMVAIYMMPKSSNLMFKNAGPAGVSFTVAPGHEADMSAKWENDADANYIAKRGGGPGTYALKTTACANRFWGANRDDACSTLGFGWFGITQRVCDRSKGTAQYLCVMRSVGREGITADYKALKSKFDTDESKISDLRKLITRQGSAMMDAKQRLEAALK